MKKSHRIMTIAAAAIFSVASLAAFTGCETSEPEISIYYEFNGEEYRVDYVLSRKGAPQTVRHFIELAETGYYSDTIIHNYDSDGTFLYGGGYTWNSEAGDFDARLVEKDYWTTLREYEEANDYTYTQSVYDLDGNPLYTVYGEFSDNGCEDNSRKFNHSYTLSPGALVMYYTEKGTDTTRVSVQRSDGGSNNSGSALQTGNYYKYNSATSMFYTWTGTGSRSDLDETYCVFGHAKDFSQIQALLDAITQYTTDNLSGEEESFTEEVTVTNVNQYDPIEVVRESRIPATYNVPVEPIYIRSVEVTKY